MIYFVNAKINIGLQIGETRPDGYHNLRTIFYPVGLYAGTPSNPEPFCDILEVAPAEDKMGRGCDISFTGRSMDCPPEKNLVTRAADLYMSRYATPDFSVRISLEKHLPDGARSERAEQRRKDILLFLDMSYCAVWNARMMRAR